jgi:hypothetical protein
MKNVSAHNPIATVGEREKSPKTASSIENEKKKNFFPLSHFLAGCVSYKQF